MVIIWSYFFDNVSKFLSLASLSNWHFIKFSYSEVGRLNPLGFCLCPWLAVSLIHDLDWLEWDLHPHHPHKISTQPEIREKGPQPKTLGTVWMWLCWWGVSWHSFAGESMSIKSLLDESRSEGLATCDWCIAKPPESLHPGGQGVSQPFFSV